MHKISKVFEFDYGHRVWSQNLDENLSLTNLCKCRHLHGHRGVVGVELCAEKLTDGMVTDFNHLNWFKKFIDDNLDHKFILDANDPLFSVITGLSVEHIQWNEKVEMGEFNKASKCITPEKRDFRESFTLVKFVPTSENLCEWLYKVVTQHLKESNLDIKVSKVFFKETPKSYSEYTPS